MSLATITTKGQVTIPKNIRESLKLHTGDKIEITLQEGGIAIIRPIANKVDDVFGKLHKPGRKTKSIEDMNDAIKNKLHDKFQ
jgi:AbrB family looped-hinge helix DNA binding protein